ncbi:hypothetical protein SAMN05421847_0424 [Halpernia humi]|uniref:Outer membrane protein beta-barrel domain-containing protein n=1 Tax=Halpernia humi TaxID=493375 RepID=A0A1H5TBI6_9FLAO|nr:hypothetical protein [Halpernia humi]SEF60146.1 hypothetical protein SAMN05421847_0424 [Halpernia humi]
MKTKLLLILGLSISLNFYAQNTQTLEMQVKNYTQKVDSIVTSEKVKMNKELDIVDQNFANGTLTEDQKIMQSNAIAEKYEKSINEKVNAERNSLDEITKNAVKKAVIKDDYIITENNKLFASSEKNSVISINSNTQKTPKNLLKNNDLSVSYAFLNLTKNSGSFNPFETDSEMRIGNSHSFEIQARHERQVGGFESPVFIRYGLAYRSDTYMPKRPQVFVQNNDRLFLQDYADGNLKRSKLRNVYITLPVEFQFVLNPKYTNFEDVKYLDATKKQFRIGVGVYAGVNTRSIVKVKYHDVNGKFQKYDYTLDYGVNPFLFGGKLSISYGGFNIFIKKDFTSIFNSHADLPNKNAIQIGIDLSSINF